MSFSHSKFHLSRSGSFGAVSYDEAVVTRL
jgi:hypothetical protein